MSLAVHGSQLQRAREWIEARGRLLFTLHEMRRGARVRLSTASAYLSAMKLAGYLTPFPERRTGIQHRNHENLYRWDGRPLSEFRMPPGKNRRPR